MILNAERTEGESERQLRKWGFESRGEHVSYTIFDHPDGRTILLYDDGTWVFLGMLRARGTASLIAYLRSAT